MMGITSTVFFMLLCQFGSSIQTCRECQCCNYEHQFCDSSKNCTGDCIAGYYGENCTEQCLENCLTCVNGTECNECKPGYYTAMCNKACGKGCDNNTCLISSGECPCKSDNFITRKCDACSGDKYGDECNKTCPSNCVSCMAETKCSWCKNSDYYGSYCQYRCSVGCFNGRCGKGNGHCTRGCKPGFVGKKCDMCSPGFYGTFCDLNCTEKCSKCLFANKCTECKLGFYGETCTNICPTGCDGNNQSCDMQTGHCLEGCKINYFGSLCNNKCPDNCQSNDSKRICDDMNGYCTFGCKDGFRGEKCDKKCSSHCENATCNQVTDECLYGCTGGFEGLKCVQAIKSAVSEQKKPLVIIASSAGAGVAVIVLLVILVICLIKRNRSYMYPLLLDWLKQNISAHTKCEKNDYVLDMKEIPKQIDEDEPVVLSKPFKPKQEVCGDAGKEYETEYDDDQNIPAIDNGYTAVNIGTSANEQNKTFEVCEIAHDNKSYKPLGGNDDYAAVNKGKSTVTENECIEEMYDTTHDNKKNKHHFNSNNDYAVISVRSDNTESKLTQPDDVYDSAEGGKPKTLHRPSNDYAVFNCNNGNKHVNDKANTMYNTNSDKKKMRQVYNDYDLCELDTD